MSRRVTLVIRTALNTQNKEGVLADFLGQLPDMVQKTFGDEDVVITISSAASAKDSLTQEQIQAISTDVSVCEKFSGRARNALRNAGFFHIATLPFVEEIELWKIKNFGKRSLNNVVAFLKENGLGPDARSKIDRYIIERFSIDPASLKKLRMRLSSLEFTGVEAVVLAACGIRTLAGAIYQYEQVFLRVSKFRDQALWVRNTTFDPNELMEKLRRVVREQGFTFDDPELKELGPWIAM